MGRAPQRERPKKAIQFKTDADIRAKVAPLLNASENSEASLSRLVEDLAFLAQSIHAHSSTDQFAQRFYAIEAQRLAQMAREGRQTQALYHVTIDTAACSFLDMLKEQCSPMLHARSEFIAHLLYSASCYCADEAHVNYLAQRLRRIEHDHPKAH